MSSTPQTNKRRRTDDTATHISELPVGILVDVSAYLAKPSRALFAVAFIAPSSSWQNKNNDLMHRPSSISTAIVSAQQWDTLDFEDIEKSLEIRLSDDDMYAVLQCINARNVLKKLKLTGCTNITGRGLIPLRESVALEQIDLSLLKQYDKPDDSETHNSMNKDIVLPILDSISSIGCSLKHILFPNNWKEDDDGGPLHEFANRYDQYQENQGISCSGCTERIRGHRWFKAKFMYHYNTCYDCLKSYCEECEGEFHLNYCNICKKDYCKECDRAVQDCNTPCSGCRYSFPFE